MMTATERLIEAVIYASEEDESWFELFNSKAEARKVLRTARNEEPDEEQIAQLIAYTEYEDMFDQLSAYEAYKLILTNLKEELEDD